MNPKRLKEILATHAEELLGSQVDQKEIAADLSDEDMAELASLLGVAEQINTTLKPVTPGRGFEDQLKRELLTTAHLHQAEGFRPPNPERDLLILTAVVGILLSLAGLLIVLRIKKFI
jgi:hypothetical protein